MSPDILFCSECLKNEGLRLESLKVGISNDSACPNCGSKSGVKLTLDKALELMGSFFEHGTAPLNVGGYAPILKVHHNAAMDSVFFEDKLQIDYELLKVMTGHCIFHYGPPLWKLGLTEHFEDDLTVKNATIISSLQRCEDVVVGCGYKFYRIRKNVKEVLSSSQYDSPPDSVVKEHFRFDDRGFPVLYCSDDLDACLHECRVSIDDDIYLSTLKVERELRLKNIGHSFKEKGGITPFESEAVFFNGLSFGTKNYSVCRQIAVEARSLGYDGLFYLSRYTQIKKSDTFNVALFGRPIEDGRLSVASLNQLRLDNVAYEFTYGPVSTQIKP